MSRILDAIGRLWPARSAAGTKASAVGPLIAWEPLGQPVWAPRDYAAFAREGFMQNAIVYRSVRMIAEAAASVPLLLYEGDNEITEHPLLDLIARPSPDQTTADFLEAWYGFLLVAGNAYVEAVGLSGRLRELHVLRPDRMKVIPGPDGWPEAFEYSAGGRSVRFETEPVAGVRPILHVKLFHPINDHYGMSPIEAAANAIDIHNAAGSWNKALLDNAARPSGALVYAGSAGNLTGEQYARLKSELEDSYQGARNAGRPLLLEGGLDWKALSLSPKDMDFVEAKHAAAREIALALGVPPMLLGIPGDNTYSNYQEAQRAFWRGTVLPLVARMTKAFSGWLAPAYGSGIALKPDLDQVEGLAAEREALWARLNAATFLTVTEKRAAVGYAPVDVSAPDATTPEAKAGFDPNQPRVPEGNEDGGQWTDGGGGGGGSGGSREGQRIRVAGRGKIVKELVKRLLGSTRTKTPDFLVKRSTPGKITGKLDDLTESERKFAEELRYLGNDVEIVPRGAGRTPDLKINGKPHELKTVDGVKSTDTDALSDAISNRILNARGQAADVIVDARKQAGMTRDAAERAVRRAYGADSRKGIDSITILTPDGPVYAPRR